MKEKVIGTTVMKKDGNVQLPQVALDKLHIEEGDHIKLKDISQTDNPNEFALQITKNDTTFVTVEIPTTIYDQARSIMKKHDYDTTVDQFIENAALKFLKKFNSN